MEYRITDWDPPRRVVLVGEGSGVWSRDDIRFEATPTGGTTVHYKVVLPNGYDPATGMQEPKATLCQIRAA